MQPIRFDAQIIKDHIFRLDGEYPRMNKFLFRRSSFRQAFDQRCQQGLRRAAGPDVDAAGAGADDVAAALPRPTAPHR